MNSTTRKNTRRNAPIASLQEVYVEVDKGLSRCVVVGDWALRLSLYDNETWNTGSIDMALAEKPTAKGIKVMLKDDSFVLKSSSGPSDGSARIELLKKEKGYQIPVNLLYDEDGSKLTHRVPTPAMCTYSVNVGIPKVRIPNRAVLLSCELMKIKDARQSGDKESEDLHIYNSNRLVEDLYRSDIDSFRKSLDGMSKSAQQQDKAPVQTRLISSIFMPLRKEGHKKWPTEQDVRGILEEAARL